MILSPGYELLALITIYAGDRLCLTVELVHAIAVPERSDNERYEQQEYFTAWSPNSPSSDHRAPIA